MNTLKDKILSVFAVIISIGAVVIMLLWDSLKKALMRNQINDIKEESKTEVANMTDKEKVDYLNNLK